MGVSSKQIYFCRHFYSVCKNMSKSCNTGFISLLHTLKCDITIKSTTTSHITCIVQVYRGCRICCQEEVSSSFETCQSGKFRQKKVCCHTGTIVSSSILQILIVPPLLYVIWKIVSRPTAALLQFVTGTAPGNLEDPTLIEI